MLKLLIREEDLDCWNLHDLKCLPASAEIISLTKLDTQNQSIVLFLFFPPVQCPYHPVHLAECELKDKYNVDPEISCDADNGQM